MPRPVPATTPGPPATTPAAARATTPAAARGTATAAARGTAARGTSPAAIRGTAAAIARGVSPAAARDTSPAAARGVSTAAARGTATAAARGAARATSPVAGAGGAAEAGESQQQRRELARVVRLHRSAVRAGAAGQPATAAKRATEALRLLGWPGDDPSAPALAARLLLTLAHAEAEQGRTDLGLELLDRAEALADLADIGTVLQQRGLLLLRVGEIDAALKLLDAAVPVLQEHGEPAILARTLLNRGVVHLTAGRVRLARADLRLCRDLAGAHGLDLLAAKVEHNLGYCALAGGDVPAALQTFDAAAGSLRRLRADGFLAISMLDRGRALLGAGLDTAAAEELDQSIELLKRHRLSQDLGEAELARAQAALGSGDLAAAALWSARARARFTRRRNRAWAALAASLQVRVDLAAAANTQPPPADDAPTAPAPSPSGPAGPARPSTDPAASTQPPPADDARTARTQPPSSLAGPARPSTDPATPPPQPAAPSTQAPPSPQPAAPSTEPAPSGGVQPASVGVSPAVQQPQDPAGGARRKLLAVARRATRLAATLRDLGLRHDAGSAELLALRARLAAGDIPGPEQRVAARRVLPGDVPLDAHLLRRLTRAELHRADGRPRAALDELRKGLATLQEHRRRFGSLELQSSVAALGADLGACGLDISWSLGPPGLVFDWSERSRAQSFRIRSVLPPQDPQVAEALAELRQLRRAVRLAELEGRPEPLLRARCAELEQAIRRQGWWAGGTEEGHGAATHADVQAELARAGRCMVSFLVRRDRLHALVLAGGAITSVQLGAYAPVAEAVRRLLSDLDTAADRRLPPKLAAVVRASADRQAATLDQALIAPVLAALGPHDVVLVPTRQLAVLPWGLLPSLRGRPVSVAPSASVWLAARTVDKAGATGAPLLVAGPDLVHADAEIDAIAALYPRGRVLRGAAATATSVLAGMDAAPVVHVAAHGHHDTQNVLFSRLELGDGPLLAYELQRLGTAPGQVVLSACDVGRAVVRAGDEIVGFTAALLHAGTANVVASVARVPDELGPKVMAHYHRAIAAGVSPARALADLPEATPFVCFGAG